MIDHRAIADQYIALADAAPCLAACFLDAADHHDTVARIAALAAATQWSVDDIATAALRLDAAMARLDALIASGAHPDDAEPLDAASLSVIALGYDPSQPRDEQGRFGSGGANGVGTVAKGQGRSRAAVVARAASFAAKGATDAVVAGARGSVDHDNAQAAHASAAAAHEAAAAASRNPAYAAAHRDIAEQHRAMADAHGAARDGRDAAHADAYANAHALEERADKADTATRVLSFENDHEIAAAHDSAAHAYDAAAAAHGEAAQHAGDDAERDDHFASAKYLAAEAQDHRDQAILHKQAGEAKAAESSVKADRLSAKADAASVDAANLKTPEAHALAERAHEDAREAHVAAASAHPKDSVERMGHQWAAGTHANMAQVHEPDARRASQDANTQFARDVSGKSITDVKAFGAKGINAISTGKVGGHDVFVKPPATRGVNGSEVTFDAKDAVAMHEAVRQSAEAMGVAHMVEPAVLHDGNFMTKSAGPDAKTVESTPSSVLAKVSEHDRLACAVIDHLHKNTDRHDENALINGDGRVTLIDHDRAHGHVETYGSSGWRSQGITSATSIFFRGGVLGYKSEQKSGDDLPAKIRDHVRDVATAPVDDTAKRFGLSPEEARLMKNRAIDADERGLTQAWMLHGGHAYRGF